MTQNEIPPLRSLAPASGDDMKLTLTYALNFTNEKEEDFSQPWYIRSHAAKSPQGDWQGCWMEMKKLRQIKRYM